MYIARGSSHFKSAEKTSTIPSSVALKADHSSVYHHTPESCTESPTMQKESDMESSTSASKDPKY